MALNMKSSNNQSRNIKKGSKGKYFKGRCNHCGTFGHKKADCWDLKNKRNIRKTRKRPKKDRSKVRGSKCGNLGNYANECKNDKDSSGDGKNHTFAMMCYENSEDDANGNGDSTHKSLQYYLSHISLRTKDRSCQITLISLQTLICTYRDTLLER